LLTDLSRPILSLFLLRSMEPKVSETHLEPDGQRGIRMLALVPVELQARILDALAPLGARIDFMSTAAEVSYLVLSSTLYHVALLPAALSDNGWWTLWGEIALLQPRPEILVYAQNASFELWSGVLEIGGHDVIAEPFSGEELRRAVSRAASSFAERCSRESADE
jgi:DNA-binding response OmpR family regulator